MDGKKSSSSSVTAKKYELIICENQPIELPPDVVRCKYLKYVEKRCRCDNRFYESSFVDGFAFLMKECPHHFIAFLLLFV